MADTSGCLSLVSAILNITADCLKAGVENRKNVQKIKSLTSEVNAMIVELDRLIRLGAASNKTLVSANSAIEHTKVTLKKTRFAVMVWHRRTEFKSSGGFHIAKHGKTIGYRILYSVAHRDVTLQMAIDRLADCCKRLHRTIALFPYQVSDTLFLLSPHLTAAWKCTTPDNGGSNSDTAVLNGRDEEYLTFIDGQSVRVGKPDPKDQKAHVFHMLNKFTTSISPSSHPSQIATGLLQPSSIASMQYTSELVFTVPKSELGRTPRTLRDMLENDDMKGHSLSDRMRFARTLVTSVVLLHSLGIVHKNVRPESIIVFEEPHTKGGMPKLGTPYLVGFEQSCRAGSQSANTSIISNNSLSDVYVHPDVFSSDRKAMQLCDDRYSLGVCLIEIALWFSFYGPNDENEDDEPENRMAYLGGKAIAKELADPWEEEDSVAVDNEDEHTVDSVRARQTRERIAIIRRMTPGSGFRSVAAARKELLKELVRQDIPPVVGDGFADIIIECLSSDADIVREVCGDSGAEPAEKERVDVSNEPDGDKSSYADEGDELEHGGQTIAAPDCGDLVQKSATSAFSNVTSAFVNASLSILDILKGGVKCSSSSCLDSVGFIDIGTKIMEAGLDASKIDENGEDDIWLGGFDSLLKDLCAKGQISQGMIRSIHAIRGILLKLESIRIDSPPPLTKLVVESLIDGKILSVMYHYFVFYAPF